MRLGTENGFGEPENSMLDECMASYIRVGETGKAYQPLSLTSAASR